MAEPLYVVQAGARDAPRDRRAERGALDPHGAAARDQLAGRRPARQPGGVARGGQGPLHPRRPAPRSCARWVRPRPRWNCSARRRASRRVRPASSTRRTARASWAAAGSGRAAPDAGRPLSAPHPVQDRPRGAQAGRLAPLPQPLHRQLHRGALRGPLGPLVQQRQQRPRRSGRGGSGRQGTRARRGCRRRGSPASPYRPAPSAASATWSPGSCHRR